MVSLQALPLRSCIISRQARMISYLIAQVSRPSHRTFVFICQLKRKMKASREWYRVQVSDKARQATVSIEQFDHGEDHLLQNEVRVKA